MIFEITIINEVENSARKIVFDTLATGQMSDEEAFIEAIRFAHSKLNRYEFVATIDCVAN